MMRGDSGANVPPERGLGEFQSGFSWVSVGFRGVWLVRG